MLQDLNPGPLDPFAWTLPLDQKAKLEKFAKNWLLMGKRFLVSQSDVDEFENWEHVPNAYEKTVSEMQSDVLEHFF